MIDLCLLVLFRCPLRPIKFAVFSIIEVLNGAAEKIEVVFEGTATSKGIEVGFELASKLK